MVDRIFKEDVEDKPIEIEGIKENRIVSEINYVEDSYVGLGKNIYSKLENPSGKVFLIPMSEIFSVSGKKDSIENQQPSLLKQLIDDVYPRVVSAFEKKIIIDNDIENTTFDY